MRSRWFALLASLMLLAATSAMSLEEVVQLPPALEATPVEGSAAWLDEIDPTLGTWVVDAAAVRPDELPGFGGGVVFAHGVRFESETRARRVWEAIRAADAGDGRRYDVEGFGAVHAHRDPLGVGGVALTDYFRLVGVDMYVVKVRVDGFEELPDEARDVLAWHVEHTGGSPGLHPAVEVVAVLAVAGLLAFLGVQLWRRR